MFDVGTIGKLSRGRKINFPYILVDLERTEEWKILRSRDTRIRSLSGVFIVEGGMINDASHGIIRDKWR